MTRLLLGDVAEVMAVRWAWSPAWEVSHAVRSLRDPRARPYHRSWHEEIAERARHLDLRPLAAVSPLWGWVPDFLTPPPDRPAPRIEEQLAQVRATPPEQVAAELRRCRADVTDPGDGAVLDALLADPGSARDVLADRMAAAWEVLVAPYWPRLRALLDQDIARRSRTLADHGLRRVLETLHPRITWAAGSLKVADRSPATVAVGSRGVLLLPSAYIWPAVAAVVDPPWQPTIVYPASGIAALWRAPQPPPDALARLLGRTRALILASLDEPASTTALAASLGVSPAGVSGHLGALRDAGLLRSTRHGHEVHYERTDLGDRLLAGHADRRPAKDRRSGGA